MELLELIGAASTPAATALGLVWWLVKREFGDLNKRLDKFEASERECQKERRTEEAALHGRVTEQGKELARVQGRLNGHAS